MASIGGAVGAISGVTDSAKSYTNWVSKKAQTGTGLQYKFTNFENRLIRWILEKQGFKESV